MLNTRLRIRRPKFRMQFLSPSEVNRSHFPQFSESSVKGKRLNDLKLLDPVSLTQPYPKSSSPKLTITLQSTFCRVLV